MYIYIYILTHPHTHAQIHAHMHKYTCTQTHTYTNTPTPTSPHTNWSYRGGHGIVKRGRNRALLCLNYTHTSLRSTICIYTPSHTHSHTHQNPETKPCSTLSQTHTHVSEVHDVRIHPLSHTLTHTQTRRRNARIQSAALYTTTDVRLR